jgi:hypothetical protein
MRKILLITFCLVFSGCENPYSQFYADFTGGKNVLEDSSIIMPTNEPSLIQGSNMGKDDKRMLEEGYILLGYSAFNAATMNQNLAIQQAVKIHADTVIVYSAYTNTLSGIMPMTVPNTQTSYHSGSIYGSGGGYANYSGTSTTYGTQTMYMPYNVNRYDYSARFWVKKKPPRFGVATIDLTDELRTKMGSNKGVYVFAVVKGSPAFDSDLLSGDVIRCINGQEIIDFNHFMKLLDRVSEPAIELDIFRNGENIKKKVLLRY